MLDPAVVERIRTIFLQERPHVSFVEAALLLGWTRDRMNRAISDHELEVTSSCSGKAIPTAEVMAKALDQWPLETIEEALASEVALVLPPGLRAEKIVAYLPRYQAQMLLHLATTRETTIGHLLAFELDVLATEHLEELAAAIPDFADAFEWPNADVTQRPC